jgi:adenosylhomocysteine nucleosidase
MKKKQIADQVKVVVIISAYAEWKVIRELFPAVELDHSPFGECFIENVNINYDEDDAEKSIDVVFFHGGWGKISAAASAQFVIDLYQPELLLNLGTCGGFKGEIDRGSIILAEKTIVYDIYELMYPNQDHIDHYTTEIDVAWLDEEFPYQVQKTLLVSGDRDLSLKDIPELKAKYQAIAGDWESGAIAYIARLNKVPAIIMRGVSDLVGEDGGEAYANVEIFERNTQQIMKKLVENLPYVIKSSKYL